MKKRLLVGVVLMLVVFAISTMLAAQEKAPAGKEMAARHKEMKLTDDQKAKVEELKTNQRLKTIDLKADLQKLGIMLKQEMMKPEPNKQELEGIVKKMSVAREKLQLAHIEHMLAMRKILGPDWRAHMSMGGGEGCKMMEGPGMMEGCGMAEGPGMKGGAMDQGSGGCMMHRSPMPGAARERGTMRAPMRRMMREGKGRGVEEKRMVWIEKSGSGKHCCSSAKSSMGNKSCKGSCSTTGGSWNQKMFRPFGKKDGHSCSGDCKGMGEMKGCGGEGNGPRRIEVKVIGKE